MKNEEKKTILSYKLKVIATQDEIKEYLSIADRYNECYNEFSKFIVDNINTMTIGEIGEQLKELGIKTDNAYMQTCLHEANKDLKMYRLFSNQKLPVNVTSNSVNEDSKLGANHLNNIFYPFFKKFFNIKNGETFSFFTGTAFYRNGCFAAIMGNLKSYFSNNKLSVKKCTITNDSDFDNKMLQVLYEIQKNSMLEKSKGWDDEISYLKEKSNESAYSSILNRMLILRDFFNENKDLIPQKLDELYINQLSSRFSGSDRKSTTLTFNSIKNKSIEKGEYGNNLKLNINEGVPFSLDLKGHRKLIKNGEFLFDTNDVSDSLNFQFVKKSNGIYEMYIIIAINNQKLIDDNVSLENDEDVNNAIVVGCDVNIKHIIMTTSMKDNNNLKGYVNLWDKILSDKEMATLLKSIYKTDSFESLKELSKHVTFGLLESDLLHSRFFDDNRLSDMQRKIKLAEKRMTTILESLKNSCSDSKEKFYICSNIKLRNRLCSYYKIVSVYNRERSIYDNETYHSVFNCDDVSYVINNKSVTKGDEYLQSHPFFKTDKAKELLEKRRNILDKIKGTRDSIVEYAYNILYDNGVQLLSLEKLETSQFEKYCIGATTTSLLKKHKMLGMTIEQANSVAAYSSHKNYYQLIFDDSQKISDIIYTDLGNYEYDKALFYNSLIKSIGFASIKDNMAQLASTRKMKVAYAPAMYSSQMDSNKHIVYTKLDKTGNEVISSKKDVRITQECHINGMNADINSAKNLEYMVKNEKFRNLFTKRCEYEYGKPLFLSNIKSNSKFLKTIRKENLTQLLE